MSTKRRFYFIGYNDQQHDTAFKNYTLLFTSNNVSSLYQALEEFRTYKAVNQIKCKVIKILESPAHLETAIYDMEVLE
ncbi:MAG: hypothetical protein PWQ70_1896 [Clostridiales bacterium]|nr:hypothetical protein [Clostridiales bacterium]